MLPGHRLYHTIDACKQLGAFLSVTSQLHAKSVAQATIPDCHATLELRT